MSVDWPITTVLVLSWLSALAIGFALGVSAKYAWDNAGFAFGAVLPHSSESAACSSDLQTTLERTLRKIAEEECQAENEDDDEEEEEEYVPEEEELARSGNSSRPQTSAGLRRRRGLSSSATPVVTVEADAASTVASREGEEPTATEPTAAEPRAAEPVLTAAPAESTIVSKCSEVLRKQLSEFTALAERLSAASDDELARGKLVEVGKDMRAFFSAINQRYSDKDKQTLYRVMSACGRILLEHDFFDVLRRLQPLEISPLHEDTTWIIEFCVPHIWSF